MAFTLAEVLIVIGIIGIVAEMTIPDLVYNSQKQVAATKLRQAYSILTQISNTINIDCSGDMSGCLTNPNALEADGTTTQEAINLYKQKLSLSKDCTNGSRGCFAKGNYAYLDNTVFGDIDGDPNYLNTRMILANGVSLCFYWHGLVSPRMYMIIYVDTNNTANPNTFGKDLFLFYYDLNQRRIVTCPTNDCTTNSYGMGCSSKIIQEGTINYY
jgi:type II secretory pathway pseudopilin PulG